jgi:RNA polymerase sigma-70 factor (ECF subfamily)
VGIERQLSAQGQGRLCPEEILQETFVRALGAIERFEWQGADSFDLWLRGIARNVLLKAASQSRRTRVLKLPEQVPASSASPSKAIRRDERFDRLERALAQLSAEYREVLRLARLEGLKVSEIAVRMNRSENAVRLLLARAAMKLRKTFGDTESLHLPDRTFNEEGDTHGRE